MSSAIHPIRAALLTLAALTTNTPWAGDPHHDAHAHGSAELNVVRDGGELYVELISPAVNIVGFEHAPSSDAEKRSVATAAAVLRDGDRLLGFDVTAGCRMQDAELSSVLLAEVASTRGRYEQHDHDAHAGHADIAVDYHFVCTNPDQLRHIDVRLFDTFPGVERLHVQFVLGNRQGAAELTDDHRRLRVREPR